MLKKRSTKKDELKKQKRNQWIIGGILILVMVLSAFGIAVDSFGSKSEETKIDYNGFTFYAQNNYWILPAQNFNLIFSKSPLETNISVKTTKEITDYTEKPLYILSENSQATYEIYQNMEQFVERIQPACLNDTENCDENLPVKDCTNNFLIIKNSNKSSIHEEENCVFIEAETNNIMELTDEFLYQIFNIK